MKNNFTTKTSIKYFGFLFFIAVALQACIVAQPVPQPYPVAQTPPPPPVVVQAPPPAWAPAYNNSQVQYYYLPDIQCYYDVWNQQYVYMENGNWMFSTYWPAMYGNYDLYAGHVVVLDYRVHQPWMHHELYAEHYPRYYHQSGTYGDKVYATGFDENSNQHYYGPRTNNNGHLDNNEPRNNNGNPPPPNQPRGNNPPPPNQPRGNEPPPNEPRNPNDHQYNNEPRNNNEQPHYNNEQPRNNNEQPRNNNEQPRNNNEQPHNNNQVI